jgi:hypothetical protein
MNGASTSRRPSNAAPNSTHLIGSPLSDPGLPSPQSFFIERTQSLDAIHDQQQRLENERDLMGTSPSAFSEIEVILDDGTIQKRTVSLSTLPDNDDEDNSSSSNNIYTKNNHSR